MQRNLRGFQIDTSGLDIGSPGSEYACLPCCCPRASDKTVLFFQCQCVSHTIKRWIMVFVFVEFGFPVKSLSE